MNKATQTHLICSCCSNVYSMFRRNGRGRKSGHIKHVWCYRCEDRTAHVEDNRKYV